MNDAYVRTVQLLLDIAPAVFETPVFAMKGGTALNLFVQDMPRLRTLTLRGPILMPPSSKLAGSAGEPGGTGDRPHRPPGVMDVKGCTRQFITVWLQCGDSVTVAAIPRRPVLHGDNGATLKATTALAMLKWLGVKPS